MKGAALLMVACAGCSWLISVDDLAKGGGPPPDGGPGPDRPATCSANLASDPANCGACGHSCLGGDCRTSRCQPIRIADGQDAPLGIFVSVDTDDVFWVNRRLPALLRGKKESGAIIRHLEVAGDLQDPFDLVVDDRFVYWSELKQNTIFKKPLEGGTRTEYAAGPREAAFLAIAGGTIYTTDYHPGGGSITSNTLMSSFNLFTEPETVAGLAVRSNALYWARQGSNGGVFEGVVMSGAATTPTQRAVTTGRPMGVAVDGASIYWIEDGLRVMAKAGGAPELLHEADQAFGDSDIAVDNTAIYWTESLNGVVRRLAKP